jgi:predicted dienelactone hydrolase
MKAFESTLLNRNNDIRFMIDEVQRMATNREHFLRAVCSPPDTAGVGLLGFSMGGFGVVNVGGAGYNQEAAKRLSSMRSKDQQAAFLDAFANRCSGNNKADPRVRAIVAFAPWGRKVRAECYM